MTTCYANNLNNRERNPESLVQYLKSMKKAFLSK